MKLLPFFTYYGGKNRAAKLYPPPMHDTIIEPFAGSAGYSMNYPGRQVILRDLDPIISGTWRYLINVPESEIAMLPDIEPGQTVDDLDVSQEARWLIGWWLNKGSSTPKRRPLTFMLRYPEGGPYWGPRVRDRIIQQLPAIRHWQVELGGYESSPDRRATWFIDPPYRAAGKHYRFDSAGLDYDKLASWCQTREGQIIVCESGGADWLPFTYLCEIDGNEGRQKRQGAAEYVWLGPENTGLEASDQRHP